MQGIHRNLRHKRVPGGETDKLPETLGAEPPESGQREKEGTAAAHGPVGH